MGGANSPSGIGADVPRIDGRLKVTGGARYATDHPAAHVAYAYLRVSSIARGRVQKIDQVQARAVPGLLEVLTHENVGRRVRPGKKNTDRGYMGSSIAPLYDSKIHYAGQIVAITIAETFEAAREAALRLEVIYDGDRAAGRMDSPGADESSVKVMGGHEAKIHTGNAAKAFAAANVKIDAWYETPTQHHNPLELFSCVCSWSGRNLTVWEGSQNVRGFQHGLAKQLGIKPQRVRVLSQFIGGAFGSRGSLNQYTALIALAAKRLGRPVKLVVTREQCFTVATYRAETRQHLQLGAAPDGRLQSLTHDGWELTSRADRYAVSGIESTTRIYQCPNVSASVRNVRADRNSPGFMRAPPETPYMFALESGMDELAHALGMDPVKLRRVNDTTHEPIRGLPYTSRSLMACFDLAAEAFRWSERDPRPGSMRDGDWLVGYGCASALYPTQLAPATARVTLNRDGSALVETGSHDIGTGAYTVIAQTAAEGLGLPIERIRVELGDSRLPPAPLAAGSSNTASVCNVVAKACRGVCEQLARTAVRAQDSALYRAKASSVRLSMQQLKAADGRAESLEVALERSGAVAYTAENTPHGAPPVLGVKLLLPRGIPAIAGGSSMKDRVQYAFGAQFVEVRVHARTREVRVRRAVGAFAAGRIMNPRTARSQLMGGQIWGISAALHESTEVDEGGRYYNCDLSEYLIPVNADIPEVQTIIVPEEDTLVNELGIKGLGELGTVGLNAAMANAVFHATGTRIRKLPIRVEQLL